MNQYYDVFNGDADGICALHQLRLVQPQKANLVTGVKRDVNLLKKIHCNPGDQVTVLDISLDTNIEALQSVLATGAKVKFFDHHSAKLAFDHPNLDLYWDDSPKVCTSILVHRHLLGLYPLWAMTAAFGDNLIETGSAMASEEGLADIQRDQLLELGSLLNYNAYGETLEDLPIPPALLYQEIQPFQSPFEFIEYSGAFKLLHASYREDFAQVESLKPAWQQISGAIYLLPNQTWARRMSGILANNLQLQAQEKSIAILTERDDGSFIASIRSANPDDKSANGFCSEFSTGGGRRAAAGINCLPASEMQVFVKKFFAYF